MASNAPIASPETQTSAIEGEESTRPRRRRTSVFRNSIFARRRSSLNRPQISRFRDHFSLQAPTSFVRFHDSKSAARVIYNEASQLVIEETHNEETNKRVVTIKQIPEETGGSLMAMRFSYTFVAAFFLGFLFAFMFQTLYFVALDFAINLDEDEADIAFAVGVFLSIPIFIHGFSFLMMLAMIYLKDLWKGHQLFRKFVLPNQSDEAVEWLFVLGLLILPLLVLAGCWLAGTEKWFEFTAMYWLFSVGVAYITFVFSVLWYEARTFVEVVAGLDEVHEGFDGFWDAVKSCVVLRNRHSLSGYMYTNYLSFGTPDSAEYTGESRKFVIEGTLQENRRGFYTRFTQLSCLQGILYNSLDKPHRLYSVDDITGRRPYVTAYSWGLERYFCRPAKTRYIGIIKGPGAVTRKQLQSTIVFAALGLFLMYFLLISVLAFLGFSWLSIAIIIAVAAFIGSFFFNGPVRRAKELAKLALLKQEHKERMKRISEIPDLGQINEGAVKNDVEELDASSYSDGEVQVSSNGEVEQVWAGRLTIGRNEEAVSSPCITSPTPKRASVTFAQGTKSPPQQVGNCDPLQLFAETEDGAEWMGLSGAENEASYGLYAVSEVYRVSEPTGAFSIVHAIIFHVFSGVWPTAALYYMESWPLATIYLAICTIVISRHYTTSEVLIQEKGAILTPDNETTSGAARWLSQNRLSNVAGVISRGKSYKVWRFIFTTLSVILVFFSIQAVDSDYESTDTGDMRLTNDFYYEPQDSLHYTSCEMYRNLNGNLASTMADYMYLGVQSYRVDSETESDLNQWYGEGVVVDRTDIVERFRESINDDIPVYYRMFTAEINGEVYAAVTVRGTQSTWDLFADGQLWGSAAFLQVVRAILPFGWVWTPILDEIVDLLSTIQTGSIERLSFYRSTTKFVNYLVESGNYTSVAILGHSLGGGLALITGAKTGIQAVAISGPNAMISRQRFGVTAEDLETYTFNIIPDRDPVAMIDDPSKNLQRIECRASQTNFMSCHSIVRSLCEAQYICGSGNRPVLCDCATKFDYPEPIPRNRTTLSFGDVCSVE